MPTPSIRLNVLAAAAAVALVSAAPAHAFGWSDVMRAVNNVLSGLAQKPTVAYGGTPSNPTVTTKSSTPYQTQQVADYLRTSRGLRTGRIDLDTYLATGQIWPSAPNKSNTTDKMTVDTGNNCHGTGCNGEPY